MTLSEWESIAKIASSVATVLILGVSATVAVFLYLWQRQAARIESIRKMQDNYRYYNQLVLDNPDLLEYERLNHKWGNLSSDEVKKMYRLFIKINMYYSNYDAGLRKAMGKTAWESHLNNLANTTFGDREFIKQHIFPRGYENAFRAEVLKRWEAIDKQGALSNH